MTAHAGEDVDPTAGGSASLYSHFVNQYSSFCKKKWGINLLHDSAMSPEIHVKDAPSYQDTWLIMFIAVLLIRARNWIQIR